MGKKLYGIFLAAAVAAALAFPKPALADSQIPKGIYLDGIDLSGKSEGETEEAVASYMSSMGGYRIRLHMHDQETSATANDLGLCWGNPTVVKKMAAYGKSGNLIRRFKAVSKLKKGQVHFPLQYGVDETKTNAVIAERCAVMDRDPSDAGMSIEDDTFKIIPEKEGVYVNVDQSVEKVSDYLRHQWRNGQGLVELPVKVEQASHKSDELVNVKNVLGAASTDYSESSTARAANIVRGAELLNGMVVYPGQEISMTDRVTPFSAENGYKPAPSYENGGVVDTYGGGICQVSTTLYMALLRAEIEITERHNHSMRVKYVKPSMDATIAEGSKDFQFRNNLEHPIYIESYTDGSMVYFNIYGVEYRPENRSVQYKSETVETIKPTTQLTATSDSFGTIKETGTPKEGCDARLWKIVTENGESKKEEINKSYYEMTPAKYSVGTKTSDGTAEAAIRDAIDSNSLDKVYQVISSY